MPRIISIIEIVVAVLLTISILLQNRGAGLSGTFGGDFGGYYTRRGMEKFLVFFSSILSTIFIILAIVGLVIGNR
ncbi:MAG: preprotein translocase subunit SecG [Candidatus Moranbacteria bacterium]|nr:preprotein translocase subunit SecG [Candidatus Moranbacteria bacterium]